MLVRILKSALRIGIALALVAPLGWYLFVRMPGKSALQAAALTPDEMTLRDELKADVQMLAGRIGERNMERYAELNAAADFIEDSFSRAGLKPQRVTYQLSGRDCHNIEAEIKGTAAGIVVIGAHYDSVIGCPGANDNGSGVAALLALTRRFAGKTPASTLRFVAFVNEEPPYFQSSQMGSFVYASRCKERGDKITAMISLETIGYFADAPGSQKYPAPGLRIFYPKVGNFIGFVGNVQSGALLRRALSIFRAEAKIPSEGAALPAFIPGVAWSDQWSFWQHGYPGFMITDTAPFRYPHYHEPTDAPNKLDYDRFALVVSGMINVIDALANSGH